MTATRLRAGGHRRRTASRCSHEPPCPGADETDALAAVIIAAHSEQGWFLLCNGVISFEDTGSIVCGLTVEAHRSGASPYATVQPCGHPSASKLDCVIDTL